MRKAIFALLAVGSMAAISTAALLIGIYSFKRMERKFADVI